MNNNNSERSNNCDSKIPMEVTKTTKGTEAMTTKEVEMESAMTMSVKPSTKMTNKRDLSKSRPTAGPLEN